MKNQVILAVGSVYASFSLSVAPAQATPVHTAPATARIASSVKAPGRMPISTVYEALRTEAAKVCREGEPMRACLFQEAKLCESIVTKAFQTCLDSDLKSRTGTDLSTDEIEPLRASFRTCLKTELNEPVEAVITREPKAVLCMGNQKSVRAAAEAPSLTKVYLAFVGANAMALKKVNDALRNGDRSICPGYSGKDFSGCYRAWLSKTSLAAGAEIPMVTAIGLTAALKDKAAYEPKTSALFSIENLLAAVEHVETRRFYLVSQKGMTPKEQTELNLLRAAEDNLLQETKTRLVNLLTTQFKSVERLPASTGTALAAWESKKMSGLRKRVEAFKRVQWRLPKGT